MSTGPSKDWKSTYNLEVIAKDDAQEISAPVTVHVTKDPQDDASLDLFAERLNDLPEILEYSVIENVDGKILSQHSSVVICQISRGSCRQSQHLTRTQKKGSCH